VHRETTFDQQDSPLSLYSYYCSRESKFLNENADAECGTFAAHRCAANHQTFGGPTVGIVSIPGHGFLHGQVFQSTAQVVRKVDDDEHK
jgi:hypothetical protein